MNPHGKSSSSSTYTNNGILENIPPPFTNPLMQLLQGMQQSPQMSNMNPFFTAAAQMQNNSWSQSQEVPPNAIVALSPLQHNQNQLGYNALGSMVPGNGMYVDASPVGSADDDPCLAQALYNSIDNGQTYKQAIESLHGINQHPAHSWKDYYLDHAPRIDVLVARLGDPVTKTVKKPFSDLQSTDMQSVDSARRAPSVSIAGSRRKTQTKPYERPKASQSQTGAHMAHLVRRNVIKLPARASVPVLPSRSPSPPTTVVPRYPSGTAHLFTDPDRVFFFDFIRWELHRDASLGKFALCEKLAKKASHHSTSSWAYFWNKHHVVANKILAAAQEAGNKMCEFDSPEISARSVGNEDIESNSNLESDANSLSDIEPDSSDFACLKEAPGDDESAMAKTAGDPYTMADYRVMAKYMVAFDGNWSALTAKERWAQFCEQHPQREYSSLQKHYNRGKAVISKLVRKYRKRDNQLALKSACVRSLSEEPLSRRQTTVSLPLSPNSAEQAWVEEGEKLAIDALNSLREYGNSKEPSTD